MKQIILFVFALTLISCHSSQSLLQTSQTNNSTNKERIIDTVRVIARDTAIVKALFECDSLGQVRIANLKAKDSEISRLQAHLSNNEFEVTVETKIVERIKEHTIIDTVYIENKVIEHQKIIIQISWWKKGLMWLGVIFLFYLTYKLKRFFI